MLLAQMTGGGDFFQRNSHWSSTMLGS